MGRQVDDDASGLVDFEEFCKLFQKTPIPTDLHGVSATLLLRHSESNLNLTGDGEVGVDLTRSLNKSGFLSVDVHGEDSMDGGATAPHTLGVVASPGGGGSSRTLTTLPPTTRSRRTKEGGHRAGQEHQRKTERSVFNDTQVSCRSGWRFNQVRRNQPGVEGENVYNVRTIKYKDLDKFVTMRKKGAEFTVKESANSRLDVRAAPELRLLLMSRAPTRPPSRAQTAPVNAAASASFFYADPDASSPARLFSPPSRPATHADGAYPRERIRAGALYPEGRFQVAGSAGPMRDFHMVDSIGSPGQRSRSAAGFSIASRSARLPAAARTRPWLANMKLEAEELTTADVLRMAAIAGLYRGDGDAPAGGAPGISFFDAGD
ncbi:hypothetical protein T484DRAFT_1743379 [Baffinella frigidus]|nr:hypothetical protein T484DRAFT_1743379 [Cryptophyta sp. CCMP2293]